MLKLDTSPPSRQLLSAAVLKKIARALAAHDAFFKTPTHTTLAFVSEKEIQNLNHDFRGKKKVTNVLSFPQYEPAQLKKVRHRKTPLYLGDIILCMAVIKKEARQEKKPLNHHLMHLIVHGALHLLGYDHMTKTKARRMETCERRILAALGIPDPYGQEKVTAPTHRNRRASRSKP